MYGCCMCVGQSVFMRPGFSWALIVCRETNFGRAFFKKQSASQIQNSIQIPLSLSLCRSLFSLLSQLSTSSIEQLAQIDRLRIKQIQREKLIIKANSSDRCYCVFIRLFILSLGLRPLPPHNVSLQKKYWKIMHTANKLYTIHLNAMYSHIKYVSMVNFRWWNMKA